MIDSVTYDTNRMLDREDEQERIRESADKDLEFKCDWCEEPVATPKHYDSEVDTFDGVVRY